MLLHAMEQWGSVITTEFWPYAISHAIRIHNSTPRHNQSKCPYTLFTDKETPHKTTDYRTLFCPVLVLEHELQDGNNIPKFSRKRSHIGVYVGHSPNHASNVILVYNPLTGLVSPQYHCVFDEAFTTVQNNDSKSIRTNINKMFKTLWKDNHWKHTDDYQSDRAKHFYFDTDREVQENKKS